MGLVSKVIPGLHGGVSQQSPVVRLDTQCEEQINTLPSIASGLQKRPPTEHVAVLTSNASSGSFVHAINRDSTERYTAIFTGDTDEPLEVYTQEGVKCAVKYGTLSDDLAFTPDNSVKAYIQENDPLSAFRATTVADHTLVVNKNKVCAMSGTLTPAINPTAIVYVKKGVADTDYKIRLNGAEVAAYTTADTNTPNSWKTSNIAQELYNDILTVSSDRLAITFPTNLASNVGGTFTITLTVAGTVVTYSYTLEPSGMTASTTAITTLKNALIASLSSDIWSVASVGRTLYVKKLGGGAFTNNLTDTSVNNGYTITQPGLTAAWSVDYTTGDSHFTVTRNDHAEFVIDGYDSWANEALVATMDAVEKFTDLPPKAPDGMVIGTTLKDETPLGGSINSGYYFKYVASKRAWQECPKSHQDNSFDASTMPHRLVRTALNEFTFCPIAWLSRQVGDDITAPEPSFIGNTVNDVFFYRNRLGFLASENLVLSKSGDFFDFWPTTALDLLDDDPIDVAANANEVSTLYHAIPFDKDLMLLSDQQQFKLSSGNAYTFTPKSAVIDLATHFNADIKCQPISVGANVYFVSSREDFSSIREYYVQADVVTNDAADITAHVPTYLPKNICKLAAHTGLDIMFALSQEDPQNLYVYKYYWKGAEKVQSSWGKWSFDGDVIGMAVLDSYLQLVVKNGGAVSLERIYLEEGLTGSTNFTIHLDRLTPVTGVYADGKTVWTLPYSDASMDFVVVRDNGSQIPAVTKTANNTLEARGDHSASVCWIGKNYTKRYTFSQWYLKNSDSNVAIVNGRLQTRSITLHHKDTGYFRIEVTPQGRDTIKHEYAGVVLGVSNMGLPSLHTNKYRAPVWSNAESVTVSILNDTYLPSNIVSGSWEGIFTMRSKPV
jgi:hypothetical protein